MSTKRWEEETLDIAASNMFSTCETDRTYNSILNIPWCCWFSYPDFYCSQNGLDIMKIFSICKEKCCFHHFF